MKLSRLFLFLLPPFLLGIVPACKKDSGKLKIAVVTNNPELFWTYCEAGARKAAQENDVELIFRKPEKGDVSVQMDIVRALEKQGVAGIAVSVLNPDNQAPDLKILAGKMKLVTMDNDAPESDRICYVGTDNYAAGRMVGKLVKEVMPNGGDLAIFVGQEAPLNARERFWGVIDELEGRKDRRIGDPPPPRFEGKIAGKYDLWQNGAVTDGANREVAKDNASKALAKIGNNPNVCMIGLWAYNPPAILEALGDKYQQVKVVAFDEDDKTLLGIESGRVHASVIQDPYQFGYKSVEILAAEARGNTSKRIHEPIPYRVVTKNGTNKDGKASETIDGVEIKYLKAQEYRQYLETLISSTK